MSQSLSKWRYAPLMVVAVALIIMAPDHTSGTDGMSPILGVVALAGMAVVARLCFALNFRESMIVFGLGCIPDMAVTHVSHHLTGSWEFEANAWVAATGTVWIVVPMTFLFMGSIYLIRDMRGGLFLARLCAAIRSIALVSHLVLWMSL